MASNQPVITLTTDFGLQDPYVGLMKGVILGINPHAEIVDLTHGIQPQNVLQGSFLLHHSHRYFTKDAIHVAVVDPGVGTNRRAVLLETSHGRFIAPDNGLLTHLLLDGLGRSSTKGGPEGIPAGWRAYHLTNADYWLQPLSRTFHGRDLFSPVAAHLSKGVSASELGDEIDSLHCLPTSTPGWNDDVLRGRVVHVDRYGNLVTDIPASLLKVGDVSPNPGRGVPCGRPSSLNVEIDVGDVTIRGLSDSYAEADGLLAIVGSFDTLEVALKNGNAASRLSLAPGAAVMVRRG